MRALLIAVSILICAGVSACGQENDVGTIEAIDDVVAKLDGAFEAQDTAAVKSLVTPDHVAVTSYYGTPQSVDELIASLPDLKYRQTDLSEPEVVLLGPNAAMRTLTAKAEGTFKGTAFSDKVFIAAIVVKQDGKWLEKFYQATRLAP